ncbi:hypothetical protein AAG570_013101, partial [Ranatra chinensis]
AGCGSGKYLSVNPSVFKLGADRCSRLTEAAREDSRNEVLVCDNLALPFRDESFDAVLSIAVVHHFATTERRVGALRELARVLRIGGRLVISVWAMEQRHRKFESQDVLVPWHRPQTLSTPSLELTATTTTSEEDSHHHHPYAACAQTSDSDSSHSGNGGRRRGRNKQKEVATSQSSSSLSSPNETCYSFVRRALQKLAGGKRGGSRNRPWFLDSWTSCASKEPPPHRYDPEGCEDIQDLPIELRRLEEDQEAPIRRQTFACTSQLSDSPLNQKSKSLSDIINVDQKSIVRSRSSVPSLELANREAENSGSDIQPSPNSKPRLVKQKKSVCDEDIEGEEQDEATDMRDLIKALPEFKISAYGIHRKHNVFKQSSMNEEIMSAERLREKERVKQNIQKQASLNEELIYSRHNGTFDSLKDTLFSTSTAKRFQLLKNGLTNKIKSSTTGIEKVAGASIKNGFVRILQGWTSGDLVGPIPAPAPPSAPNPPEVKTLIIEGRKDQPGERRHSKEDGSDSSKDSSLQSDTSVDSEDSFASVIFVPKPEQMDQPSANTSPTLQSNPASPQPTSPKIKFPPPVSPKIKPSPQIPFGLPSHPSSPKMKHSGQLLSSPTPTSPKVKYFSQPTSPRPFQTTFLTSPPTRSPLKLQSSPNGAVSSPTCKTFPGTIKPVSHIYNTSNLPHLTPTSPTADFPRFVEPLNLPPLKQLTRTPSPSEKANTTAKSLTSPKEDMSVNNPKLKPILSPGISPTSAVKKTLAQVKIGPMTSELTEEKTENFKQIQEFFHQKSEITALNLGTRTQFPLVRRSTTLTGKSDSPPSRPVPRLLSLEIFNPETDDMDSDSSGLSSPDSVGSVISIKNEEDSTLVLEPIMEQKQEVSPSNEPTRTSGVGAEVTTQVSVEDSVEVKLEFEESVPEINSSPRLSPLLEAAADVATSLEETVDAVIQSSPLARRKNQLKGDPRLLLQENLLPRSTSRTDTVPLRKDSESIRWGHKSPAKNVGAVPKKKMTDFGRDSVPTKLDLEHIAQPNESKAETWDEECRQHLAEFAEKLSEKLLAEIDRYREQSSGIQPVSPIFPGITQDIRDMKDPYLCRLSEDLHDLTKLSIELNEKNLSCDIKLNEAECVNPNLLMGRVKGEGATTEERHIENEPNSGKRCTEGGSNDNTKIPAIMTSDFNNDVTLSYLSEEHIPLLQEELEDISNSNVLSPSIDDQEPIASEFIISDVFTPVGRKVIDINLDNGDAMTINKDDSICSISSESGHTEHCVESSDAESTGSDGIWADSRRNTILPSGKSLVSKLSTEYPVHSDNLICKEITRFELLPGKDAPRRPSISVEMSDPLEGAHKEKEDSNSDSSQLHLGISVESNEAADNSEKTGSSSDGSRSGSRRETIQISDSGSILSLRPGLSIESSDAGDVSDRGGSDGSRDSRRDTISLSDVTSSSQNSLLRPGNSMESSDAGDASERTGSDYSRQNTSSAGKTPSTASFTSDRASDCSKDARFADRRMARCDGRSSSEEMPLPKTSMNKLVRQRASTQEPPETLVKTESCETSLSGSTSQDSLLSESGGGAITFHRYYHVFREGELDQLIERYVENLHIISSYYDHANWCVIAEKVQVWTI